MNLIERRRQMMMSKSLPYDAEIEYLESTGTQYVETGFVPQQDDVRAVVKVYKPTTSTGDNFVFGMVTTSDGCMFHLNWYSQTFYFRYRNYNNAFNCTYGLHEVEVGPKMIIDGVVKDTPTLSRTFVGNTNSIVLFADGNANYKLKGRIYYFKIYYGDELKLDMIPVRVGTTGYMYDKVSGQLFGNQGTGNFILGADKN
ncbi:MAG: hypothetical protein IIZ44_07775 [Muribaculaceae bacterium]|nr:hypothetical protein [Muribaculaceae bacterium]